MRPTPAAPGPQPAMNTVEPPTPTPRTPRKAQPRTPLAVRPPAADETDDLAPAGVIVRDMGY